MQLAEQLSDVNRPVEIHHLTIRPSDFFTSNPALDVPGTRNQASVTVPCCGEANKEPECTTTTAVYRNTVAHLQSSGSDAVPQLTGAKVPEELKTNSEIKAMKTRGVQGEHADSQSGRDKKDGE